jgi:hypothetical protein
MANHGKESSLLSFLIIIRFFKDKLKERKVTIQKWIDKRLTKYNTI